jgi:preprotein translocase subunit SecA
VDRGYQRYKPGVEKLFRAQQRLSNDRAAQAEKLIAEEDEMEAARLFLMVKRSTPKHKRLLKIQKEGSMKRLIDDIELAYMRDKKLHELDAENFFTYDEHMRAVELNEKGRELLNPRDPDAFTLPDLSTGLAEIDKRSDLASQQKLKAKEELYQEYATKSEMLNNHHALLKAYVLFNRDEDYIVDEGKVIIVDSFTGRPQPGRRYSDGLHEALEAKEGVRVQEETQTVATITHQNYFRMYEKLAGMTGTAMTDANEFVQVYKMDDPIAIPTNKPVRRIDYPDIVYATRNEKYQAVIEEIEHWHKTGRPILVGTTSVDVSETLSRMLKRKGINHNVLNAKQHQREAEIVREAGEKHKVTIATNMAGRGTDIKLTPEILGIETKCRIEEAQTEQEIEKYKNTKECQEDLPTGLIIIGTERHESRRIDNQLRGRSGRQGDPGASRFFLSLEDNLLRIFGADRMQKAIESFSKKEMEPISTPLVTRAIENAQKRVETNNFEMRKRLLEYDDVMNRQREEIYATRDEILAGEDLDGLSRFIFGEVIDQIIGERCQAGADEWDWEGMQADFVSYFMVGFDIPALEERAKYKPEELSEKFLGLADKAFKIRKETLGEEKFSELQKLVLLMTIDTRWREHLREMDELKKGIGLRGYGQKDPVLEYKKEAYGKYEEMVRAFQTEVTKLLFRAQLRQAPVRRQAPVHAHKEEAASGIPASAANPNSPAAQAGQEQGKPKPVTVKKKVGRNDPCPCGSGKKYKKCCYPKYG